MSRIAGKRVLSEYQKKKKKQKYRLKKRLKSLKGNDLESNTIDYYLRVEKLLTTFSGNTSESEEDRNQFYKNVCVQICDELVDCFCHPIVSGIIEKIVRVIDLSNLNMICSGIIDSIEILSDNCCASRVIESLVDSISNIINTEASYDVFGCKSYGGICELLCYYDQNVLDILKTTYASHTLAKYIQLLAGIKVSNLKPVKINKTKQQPKQQDNNICVHLCDEISKFHLKKLTSIINKIIDDLEKTVDSYVITKNHVSAFVSMFFSIKKIQNNELTRLYFEIVKFLDYDAIYDQSKSYLIQTLFIVGDQLLVEQMCNKYIMNDILSVATHPISNYVLQALFDAQSNMNISMNITTAVLKVCFGSLQEILNSGNFQVITKMFSTAHILKIEYDQYVKNLLSCFKFPSIEPRKEIIFSLLSMNPYNDDDDDTSNDCLPESTFHGSSILCLLMKMSKIITNSFEKLSSDDMFTLLTDKYGSRIVDSFFQSPLVSDEKRNTISMDNNERICSSCCNKYGRFTIETIWNTVSKDCKKLIAKAILRNKHAISSNHFGAIIFKKFRISHFESNISSWERHLAKNEK